MTLVIPRSIEPVQNSQQPHTLWSVTTTTQLSINGAFHGWKKYLKRIQPRKYFIWSDFYLYLRRTKSVNIIRRVDKTWSEQDVKNNLERELRVRIGSTSDTNLASEDQDIADFINILLRSAMQKPTRSYLSDLDRRILSLWSIDSSAEMNDDKESQAEQIYNDFVDTLRLSEEEINTICSLSWENREDFSYYPFTCRCWIIKVCIIDMIQLEG